MPDLAPAILRTVHQDLMIDDEWTVWQERAFSWVGFRLRQDFCVSQPFVDEGMEVQRAWSVTTLVENVQAPDEAVFKLLSILNRFSAGESLVWDASTRRILCHTGVIVHEETLAWRPKQLADYAILALRACEDRAGPLAESLQGSVASWRHPLNGERIEPDEMLWVPERVFIPQGQGPNRFADEAEFEAAYAEVMDTPFFSVGGSAEGMCVEVPFGDKDTTLIRLHTDVSHPTLGSGLLCTLKIRIASAVSMAALANYLNFLEAAGELPRVCFGAWCADQAAGQELLAHSRFIPNILYQPLLVVDTVRNAIARALWAAQVVLGEDEGRLHRYAHDIVYERDVRTLH